jgi:hypothetical protein
MPATEGILHLWMMVKPRSSRWRGQVFSATPWQIQRGRG